MWEILKYVTFTAEYHLLLIDGLILASVEMNEEVAIGFILSSEFSQNITKNYTSILNLYNFWLFVVFLLF